MNARTIAVCIPLYKGDFLDELLIELSSQIDTDFHVYIGNDAAPKPLEAIVSKYSDVLRIKYVEFQQNLGGRDLAAQWYRCVKMTKNEEWVWIIGDDDVPSRDAIKEIRSAADHANRIGANVIHVPAIIIDADSRRETKKAEFPYVLPALEHYRRQLSGEALSATLSNSVYRREALESVDGFVSFKKGWGSDHATPLLVASGGAVVTVRNAWCAFRRSGLNISGMSGDSEEKMCARLEYCRFLRSHLPKWCDAKKMQEILFLAYMRSEFYVIKVWPFSLRMARLLFENAEICGIRRNRLQRLSVIVRGVGNIILGGLIR